MHRRGHLVVAPTEKNVRRRPTLPQPLGCSTIGAERLNFRVRDGTGCFPFAMAAVTLAECCSSPGSGQAHIQATVLLWWINVLDQLDRGREQSTSVPCCLG